MLVEIEAEELHIMIRDDGVGFDLARARGRGNGLSNMRQRIEELLAEKDSKR